MPTLSILTPTWNRAHYLRRVWESLMAQTLTDFEWIVSDDGSIDNTELLVADLAPRSRFPVLYLKASSHVGKARMDNEAIKRARGDFVLWCDSDDWLAPEAVQRLISVWHSISPSERKLFFGVSAFAINKDGAITNPFPSLKSVDISFNDLISKYPLGFDLLVMARTEILHAHPFPEVDLYVPEGAVWNIIGHQKMRLVPDALLIKDYLATPGMSVSYSGKMAYNRGRAYAIAIVRQSLSSVQLTPLQRILEVINFLRYCQHGDLSILEARALWKTNSSALLLFAALPIAAALATIDRLQDKVVYSHREFLRNRHAYIQERWFVN